MKRILSYLFLVLVLTFSFQSWTKADDITDFQIEGISIGDSLLDYFSKAEIKQLDITKYDNSDKFYILTTANSKFELYDALQFSVKTNDKKYEIYGMGGIIWFEKNVNKCLNKKKEIEKDLNIIFKNSTIESHKERNLPYDPSGKSKQLSQTQYIIENGVIAIECTDFSESMTIKNGYTDNLKISTYSKEYEFFVRNEAY